MAGLKECDAVMPEGLSVCQVEDIRANLAMTEMAILKWFSAVKECAKYADVQSDVQSRRQAIVDLHAAENHLARLAVAIEATRRKQRIDLNGRTR
jgi:hypothetical protein